MQKMRVRKLWLWAGLLLALGLIALSMGVGAASGRAGRAAEVVYDRPLRAGSQLVETNLVGPVREPPTGDLGGPVGEPPPRDLVGLVGEPPTRDLVGAVREPPPREQATNAAPASGGSPSASLPETFFDFGSIPASGAVQHDFLLRNQGDAPLLIRQAYTTCGCTIADFSASVIPPGKASRVTVSFDPGFHPMGGLTVRRGLIIESNDPLHPQVEIWIQASVK